jgi:hypothetical protein
MLDQRAATRSQVEHGRARRGRRPLLLGLAFFWIVGVLLFGSGPGTEAEEDGAIGSSAIQLAHDMGMQMTDAGSVITLQGPYVTMRLYPGSNLALIQGKQYRMKGRPMRRGDRIDIPALPARFLTTQVYSARQDVARQRSEVVVPRPMAAPAAPATPAPVTAVVPPSPWKKHLDALRNRPAIPAHRPAPAPRPVVARGDANSRGDPAWLPRVQDRQWRYVVIHHSDDRSGNAAKYDRHHREVNGWDSLGYHFVLGNGSLSGDGEIEVGPRWGPQKHGAHARNHSVGHNRFNEEGVGICLVGDFDQNGCRPSRAQMNELVRLTRWLIARYDIPASNVLRHKDCCNTECPGRHFPWAEFQRRIRAGHPVPAEPIASRR